MTLTATPEDQARLLRPDEAAERLAVSRKTVYRLIDRGELRAVHVGRSVRIDPSDLGNYLNREGES
jgi:putative molybdopterin biosynthesis protein